MTAEALSSDSSSFPMAEIQEFETQDKIRPTLSYHYYTSQGRPMIVSDIIIAPVVPVNDMDDLNEFIQSLPTSISYPTLPPRPEAVYSDKRPEFILPLLVYSDDPIRAKTIVTPNPRIPQILIDKATSHLMIDEQIRCLVRLHVHPSLDTARIAALETYNNLRSFNAPPRNQYEFDLYPEPVATSSLNLNVHERTKLETNLPERMWPSAKPTQ